MANLSHLHFINEQAFRIFDRDSSLSIDIYELQAAMLSIGLHPSSAELAAMIARVDVDGTGTVDFDEFLRMIVQQTGGGLGKSGKEEEMKEAFRAMDVDGDGAVSVADLLGVLRELGEAVGEEEVKEWVSVVSNGADRVAYTDFIKIMSVAF